MLYDMIVNYWWQFLILVSVSYCVGNFCAAIFVSKRFIKQDIRQLGSKNPGTTNMTRVFGLKFGIITLVIDFFKAFICVIAGKLLFTSIGGYDVGVFAGYLAALAVILGHVYPVFLGFKGGKGFASGVAALIVLSPAFTVIALLLGLGLLLLTDRMSLVALFFFLIEAIYHIIIYWQGYWWLSLFATLYFALAVISHRGNIIRLMHGEEKPLRLISMLNLSQRAQR